MPKFNVTSTDSFVPNTFKPHGRAEYEERGRLLVATAYGPFNVELMEAVLAMAKEVFPKMTALGPWAHIATFVHSAMCAPAVLEAMKDAMKQMVQAGIAPAVTAFVMPPDVEGFGLMGPAYAKAFEPSGARFQYFHSIEEAHAWVLAELGPTDV
jgi:hypothetical protein